MTNEPRKETELTPEQTKKASEYIVGIFNLMTDKGNICPFCGGVAVPLAQVGRSVYGACGCRLFQGKIEVEK